MIKNVLLHIHGELPLMVDLEELPGPADTSIRCTNVRTVDGKRPTFIEHGRSTFVFALNHIRLIEAPAAERPAGEGVEPESISPLMPDFDEEPDEDLLARIRKA